MRVNLERNFEILRRMEDNTEEAATKCGFAGDLCRRRRPMRMFFSDFTGDLFFLETIAANYEGSERDREREREFFLLERELKVEDEEGEKVKEGFLKWRFGCNGKVEVRTTNLNTRQVRFLFL